MTDDAIETLNVKQVILAAVGLSECQDWEPSMIGLIYSHNREVLDRLFLNYLFFDELYVIGPESIWLPGLFAQGSPFLEIDGELQKYREFQWCRENGIYRHLADDFDETKIASEVEAFPGLVNMNEARFAPVRSWEERRHLTAWYENYVERLFAQSLERRSAIRTCATQSTPDRLPIAVRESVSTADAYQIAIQQLSIPERRTPWEELLPLKRDQEFRNKRNRLLGYCAELSSLSTTPLEVADTIRELLFEYNRYMNLLMKTQTVSFATTVTATAEIIEDIVKFRLSKLATRVLDAHSRKLEFAEKEHQAPGRQVSALAMVQKKLSYA